MKKCVIYTRVSTDHEAQAKSMGNQEALMHNYIKQRGWEYYDTYEDAGITAVGTKLRDDYNRLLDDAYAKKFDIILAKSLTRFSRNLRQGLIDINNLMQVGIRLVFFEDGMDTADPKVYHTLGLKLWLAETEARNTSERIRSTWKLHNFQGKLHACTPPYGYDYNTDANTFVINEDEARVVKEIFKTYLNGEGMSGIARSLIKQGIKTKKGGEWAQATIRSILINRVYTGVLVLGKYYHADITNKKKKKIPAENWYIHPNIYEGVKQQIIEDNLFEAVQKELINRQVKRQRHSTTAVFSGLIKCGECNSSFTVKRQKHFKNYSTYYTCVKYDHKGKKIAGHQRIAIYEDDLLEGIQEYFNRLRKAQNEELIDEYISKSSGKDIIKRLEKNLEKNKKEQSQLYALYHQNLSFNQSGELSQRLFLVEAKNIDEKLDKLEQEKNQIQRELEQTRENEPNRNELKKRIDGLLDTRKFTNLTMRQIISQIIIYKEGRIDVELQNMP